METTPIVLLALSLCGCIAGACARQPQTTAASTPPQRTGSTCSCVNGGTGDPQMHGRMNTMGGAAGAPMMMADGGMGSMMQQHMGGAMGMPMQTPGQTAGEPLSEDAKSALLRAIDEERRAEALYLRVINQFGARPPFRPISRSEHRHAWVVESLAAAHNVDVPKSEWTPDKFPTFATLRAACEAGVESEKKTIALYDDLLKRDVSRDERMAFEHLRAASAEHHLPMFQSCAAK